MRIVNRLLAFIVAVALLGVSVIVIVEVIGYAINGESVLVPWMTLGTVGRAHALQQYGDKSMVNHFDCRRCDSADRRTQTASRDPCWSAV